MEKIQQDKGKSERERERDASEAINHYTLSCQVKSLFSFLFFSFFMLSTRLVVAGGRWEKNEMGMWMIKFKCLIEFNHDWPAWTNDSRWWRCFTWKKRTPVDKNDRKWSPEQTDEDDDANDEEEEENENAVTARINGELIDC